ncbi:hypothetical protein FOMPIDRAFT_91969 [Fomitopsis schrenkii]|uniref:IRG-type G domain-containing protein n=1 Tax=Fomitopsis schrenkii TaxID=2126942 RepID=S8F4F2_FOMSC|nr:hypothetical protein FOMPIDRAFT_91969 [Fomitopsis schrenkii]
MSEILAAVKELLKDVLIVVLILREVFAQRARGGNGGMSTEERQGPGTATYLDLLREAEEAIAREERLEQEVAGARLREESLHQEVEEAKAREERLEQEVEGAKLREERLEQEVEGAKLWKERLEQEVEGAKLQESLHHEVAEAKLREEMLEQEVAEAKLREEMLEQEVAEAKLREESLHHEVEEAGLRERMLQRDINVASYKEWGLQQDVDEARSRGNQLQQEVDEARLREERLQQEVNEARLREKGLVREKREAGVRAAEAERWRDIWGAHWHEQCVGERDAREKEKEKAATAACDATAAQDWVEQELRGAQKARGAEPRILRSGIRPIIIPTPAQVETKKRRLDYHPGFFHVAVAGVSGSGKSSLINAFRGLRNKDVRAALTSVVETTSEVVRYPDPRTDTPYVWYDVPGAGTLSTPDWQYFDNQGLYIFDCIVVVFGERFTDIEIAILRNCVRFQIPSFIVRSKSKQHIANIANDMGGDQDDDDDEEFKRARSVAKARLQHIEATRNGGATQLEHAGLPAQKVYLVDKDALVEAVKGRSSADAIDEDSLLEDMFALAERARERAVPVNV